MLHDERTYSNPHEFNPARFMEPNPEPDPAVCAWGFGRRICPGRYFADESLFLTCTMILSTFNVEKDIDENGTSIEPVAEYTGNLVTYVERIAHSLSHACTDACPRHLKPFPCKITPRSENTEALLYVT
jgi:fumagillin biosynthesis cytochrome P450 monooxygenase